MSFFNIYDDKKSDAKASNDTLILRKTIKAWAEAKTPDRQKLEKELAELKSQLSQYDEKFLRIAKDKYKTNHSQEIEKLAQQIEAKMSRIMDNDAFEKYLGEHFVKPEEYENKRKQFQNAIDKLKVKKGKLEQELSHADMNIPKAQAKDILILNERLTAITRILNDPDIKTVLPPITLYSDLSESLDQQLQKVSKYKKYLEDQMAELINNNPDAKNYVNSKNPPLDYRKTFNYPDFFSHLAESDLNLKMSNSFKKASHKLAVIDLLISNIASLKKDLAADQFIKEYLNLDRGITAKGVADWVDTRLKELNSSLKELSDYISDPKNSIIKTLSEKRGPYTAKGAGIAEGIVNFIKKSQALLTPIDSNANKNAFRKN
jgi:hypothetical protein